MPRDAKPETSPNGSTKTVVSPSLSRKAACPYHSTCMRVLRLRGRQTGARGPRLPYGYPMRRGKAAGVLAIAAFLACASSAPAAPEDFGRHGVNVTRVQIPVPPDPNGPEGALPTVAADVYVPADGGPWPLVHLAHGYPGTLREFPLSGWGKRLASRGFVVIVSDRRAASSLAVAQPLDQPSDVIDLDSDVGSEDILRVLRWAIAQSAAPDSFLHGGVDPDRVSIGGHSLGAYMST